MASSSLTKKITLKSSDGVTFEIEEVVAQSIMNLTDDVADDIGILVPNVTGKILAKVIEYCKKPVEATSYEKRFELNKWDTQFVKVDYATLLDLIRAAHYLNIKSLFDLTCKTVTYMMQGKIKGKKPEEIRKIFNVVNDFQYLRID